MKDQPIDETWDARLTKVSGKFQKLKDGIRDWDQKNPSDTSDTPPASSAGDGDAVEA